MADSTIGSLPAASEITAQDLFVLEQNGVAKKLLGELLTSFINRNIVNVSVSSISPTLNPTTSYDSETGALSIGIPRGLGITDVSKTSTVGITDVYTITLEKLPEETVPTTFTFTVENGRSIVSITPISAQHNPGTFDRYSIDFNDGTAQTFDVYNGLNGTNAVSISSIAKVSGTGAGGTQDVYRVVLSDGASAGQFTVYNGADGTGAPGSASPLMDGTATVGVANAYSREDHIHPTDITRQAANLYFTNVPANSWIQQSTPTYNDFEYRCALQLTGVTSSMYADVVLDADAAMSGNYAPVCQTYNGGVYIYSKVSTTITIPSIIVFK